MNTLCYFIFYFTTFCTYNQVDIRIKKFIYDKYRKNKAAAQFSRRFVLFIN